jgi:preprotein translocase subunit SecG
MAELLITPLTVVHVIACMFLILVVLLQPGKSGGLGAFTGAAATQVFGGRGAGNILTKITWVTGTIFFATSISLAYLSTTEDAALAERAAQQSGSDHAKPKVEPKNKPASSGPRPSAPAK